MPRGALRAGSGRPVFSELQQNANPPQSTLAAQLVDHFTDGKQRSKNQDQETFRQLLQEVLKPENRKQNEGENFDIDLVVNHKLVYVIVKAGLDVLNPDNPFGVKGELSNQVIDSLAAIEITIKRNPRILFATSSIQQPNLKPSIPLYLWLLPKLLFLVGRMRDEGTRNGVLALLQTALTMESKAHIKALETGSMLKYVKGCMQGQLLQPLRKRNISR